MNKEKSTSFEYEGPCNPLRISGKHVNIVYFYDRQSRELTILLSNPIPLSQYRLLESMIVEMDGVGKCRVEHRYKLVCDVNFWHFDLDIIMRAITEYLDNFFRGLSDEPID